MNKFENKDTVPVPDVSSEDERNLTAEVRRRGGNIYMLSSTASQVKFAF